MEMWAHMFDLSTSRCQLLARALHIAIFLAASTAPATAELSLHNAWEIESSALVREPKETGGAFWFISETNPSAAVLPVEGLRKMLPESNFLPVNEFWYIHGAGGGFPGMDTNLLTGATLAQSATEVVRPPESVNPLIPLPVSFGSRTKAIGGEAQSATVVVRPVESDEVLVNPGMGIQTFQRFNGDPINPGQRWSEEGPTTKAATAKKKVEFPESSIAYCRWFWKNLEPEQGKVRWSIIDLALEQARTHNQKLDIRLMPYDEGHPLPEWYRKSGARRANDDNDETWKAWVPDGDDPSYLKYWGGLILAAGARYDGHPYLNNVDISTVGYWGEGWGPYLPSWQRQKELVDVYFEAFRRTPLLVNFDEPRALAYATKAGAGWRLDGLGDLGNTYWDSWGRSLSHMLDVYPQQVVRAGAAEAWMRSPVSLEAAWVPGYWKDKDWDLNYIIEQALRWHVSSVNIKSSAIPAEWKENFRNFEKKMGYRFVLRRFEHPKSVRIGEMIPVTSWWVNKGVAPVYANYTLAFAIDDAVISTNADLKKWLPGDQVFDDALYVPESLKPGSHTLRVAILDPRTGKPAIRLAIQGLQPDGWYELGTIETR